MSRTLDPCSESEQSNEKESFSFTLLIAVAANMADEDIANKLFNAGCDDGLFGSTNGQYFMDFERMASSFAEAIGSSIENVESVPGLKVTKVLPSGAAVIREVNACLQLRKKGPRSKFWRFLGK